MRIDAIDLFYLSMPTVTLEADGSQDALLVRVLAGDFEGWGECEASPLTSIAAFVTPRSHGVCQPVSVSVLGAELNSPEDIYRISQLVRRNSMDLLQAPHVYSGIEMAMWDLLGTARDVPVWSLLGYKASHPKTPYASMLFGDEPSDTFAHVTAATGKGFRAVKVGWGRFGHGSVVEDAEHVAAAREALGPDGILLVDAGQIWGNDLEAAGARLPALEQARVRWLEEPFSADDYGAYRSLASRASTVRIAGGEASHNAQMAINLIDYGQVGFIQIDCGRIGGLGEAKRVAEHAQEKGVTYVNHTFTSQLALSASLQPFAGLRDHDICEYPVEPKQLARDLTCGALLPDANGTIAAPDAPGLGVRVNLDAIERYQVPVEIDVGGVVLFSSTASASVRSSMESNLRG